MIFLAVLLIIGYFLLVIYLARIVVENLQWETTVKFEKAKREYEILVEQKNQIASDKIKMEQVATDIFTLYELTKEVSEQIKEDEAFEIFKQHLSENISFLECQLLPPLSKDVKKFDAHPEWFLFALKSRKRKLGYLAIRGVGDSDKEKLAILGHQFALALRRIKLYQELELLSIMDSLTKVHTRRYFMERFEEELKRSKLHKLKLSILMIDVDHFKKINDQHGHLVGDQVLHRVGEIIRDNIREIDFAGRYGGEEFCVVLPDTDSDGAQYVAERIRLAAEESEIVAYDAKVKLTVSIGVSTFPKDGQKQNTLIDKADWALYRAKKIGRNTIVPFGLYDE